MDERLIKRNIAGQFSPSENSKYITAFVISALADNEYIFSPTQCQVHKCEHVR